MISYDSEDEEEEEVEMKRCDVCSSAAAIYKCPRCGVMTCSCECCKAHKLDTGCNGKRDRTAFVGMQNFGATNLRNGMGVSNCTFIVIEYFRLPLFRRCSSNQKYCKKSDVYHRSSCLTVNVVYI